MTDVQVHEQLTVDDLFRAANLIAAVLDDLDGSTIAQMQQGTADKAELGQTLITTALRVAPDTGKAFLAGLCDVSSEQFGLLPMDAVLDIIEQLAERSDLTDFFERARGLAGRFAPAESEEPQGQRAS